MMLLICQLATVTKIYAQNIVINGTGSLPDTSAMLDVSSVNKGFLAPRMTTAQQNAIPLPAKGLLIYNITDNGFKVNAGSPASPSWLALAAGNGSIIHALTYANNVLTNTINGVGSSVNIINSVSNSSANNVLSTTVNGITGSGVPIINAVSNTSSANTLFTQINGVSGASVSIVNSNALSLNGTSLTSTINGVSSTALNLTSLVTSATTNALSSSTNTMTNNTNGVSATAPIVNTNVLAISGTNITSTVNGVASNSLNIGAAITTEPWFNVATNSGATANTQNIYQSANVGIGVTDPATQLVVKDNIEIRRVGTVAQLLFSKTSGSGDFRFGGDGGDIYWQGGGGRSLQMGSYWATILGGDRQTAAFPAFANAISGTSVIVAAMRNQSVALAVQANSNDQIGNLTEWRNSGGTALSVVDKKGNLGLGTATPNSTLQTNGSFSTAVISVNNNVTLTDAHSLVLLNPGGTDKTVSLPTAVGITGRIYTIKKIDNGTKNVSVVGKNSETIDGAASVILSLQWKYVTIQSDGSNWMITSQN